MLKKCRVCNNTIEQKNMLKVKEMQLGFREVFCYGECSSCGALSLMNEINDFSKYYDNNIYYSFQSLSKKTLLMKLVDKIHPSLYYHKFIAKFVGANHPDHYNELVKIIKKHYNNKDIRILDVGSGEGHLLSRLKTSGYKDLTGIDPFLPNDIYKKGFKLLKSDIYNHQPEKKYDIINMSHVIEHINDHQNILKRLSELISANGVIIISQPIKNEAYKIYKEHRYQIDAPRHLILHSQDSFCDLIKSSPVILIEIIYDSTYRQFFISEFYKKNIGISELSKYLWKITSIPFSHYLGAEIYNKKHLGDQAIFILKKKNDKLP